jgi:YHS domain-containing protein
MILDIVCGMYLTSVYGCEVSKLNGETYYFCCIECKNEFDIDPSKYVKLFTTKIETTNKIIEWERDPVCGEMIKIQDANAMSVYKGIKYYFCCPICKREFDKNPLAYADKDEGFYDFNK